jgi:hypothetical protein
VGILCISVDLDEIRSYHDIHGLGEPSRAVADLVYRVAPSRAARLFAELGIRGTFFAVGRDLAACEGAKAVLGDLVRAGHEVANHTMDHRYDLTLMPAEEQQAQLDDCAAVIREAVGRAPRGFRAPGYNVHLGLLDLVEGAGYAYDSSVFPCPLYLLAKAGAMGAKRLRGRESRSVIGDPRILLAPTGPYRLGRDGAWTAGEGMLELPISTVTSARIPFVGTFLTMMGETAAAVAARSAARLGFVNLELHGIDFVDADGDGVGYLAAHQPDLRIPLRRKLRVLEKVVSRLLDAGMQAMPLEDAAGRVLV